MASGSLNSSDVLAVSSFFLTAEVDDDDGVLLLDVSGGDVSENTRIVQALHSGFDLL